MNTEQRIFKYLFDRKDAFTAYAIAKDLKLQISSTKYFLEKMYQNGVVVKIKNKKNLYGLHPIFYNEDFWNEVIEKLKETMKIFTKFEYEEFKPDFNIAYALKLLVDVLSCKKC